MPVPGAHYWAEHPSVAAVHCPRLIELFDWSLAAQPPAGFFSPFGCAAVNADKNRIDLFTDNPCPAWLLSHSRENYSDVSRLHSSERRGAKQGQLHEPPRPPVAISRITSAYVPSILQHATRHPCVRNRAPVWPTKRSRGVPGPRNKSPAFRFFFETVYGGVVRRTER
jgi:hypothetical protein